MEAELVIRRRGLARQEKTQVICDELHLIAKASNNHLTPEIVLKNAEKTDSPLHDYFEWDDTEAAAKYRYIQAAMLIRSVKVSVETHPQDQPKIIRAFVSVASKPELTDSTESVNSYVPLQVALESDDYRNQMLENAFRELRSFQRKYAVLKELAGLMGEIEKLSIPA